MVFENLFVALLGLVASLAAASLAQYFAKRQRELSKRSEETAQSLANLIRTRQAEQRASILEALVERLPKGASAEEFLVRLEPLVARSVEAAPRRNESVAPFGDLVNAYHEQALSQAKVQFWFSVAAATVGFGWILYAATQIDIKELATLTKPLPGLVIDAVAFLFFKQASETRQRATELYDRLRRDREVSDSMALVAAIEDSKVRSAVRAQLALHMSGLQPAAIDLTSFISSETPPGARGS